MLGKLRLLIKKKNINPIIKHKIQILLMPKIVCVKNEINLIFEWNQNDLNWRYSIQKVLVFFKNWKILI